MIRVNWMPRFPQWGVSVRVPVCVVRSVKPGGGRVGVLWWALLVSVVLVWV